MVEVQSSDAEDYMGSRVRKRWWGSLVDRNQGRKLSSVGLGSSLWYESGRSKYPGGASQGKKEKWDEVFSGGESWSAREDIEDLLTFDVETAKDCRWTSEKKLKKLKFCLWEEALKFY